MWDSMSAVDLGQYSHGNVSQKIFYEKDRPIICNYCYLEWFLMHNVTDNIISSATLILGFGFIVVAFTGSDLIFPSILGFPTFAVINNMACHIYRNFRFGIYQGYLHRSSVDAADSNTSSSRRQQRLGIAFKSATTRSVHFTDGMDLEAARADKPTDSHEKVDQLDAVDVESSIAEQKDKPGVLT